MELMKIKESKIRDTYKRMLRKIYKDDPHYKNNKMGILDLVIDRKSYFKTHSIQQAMAVTGNGHKDVLCMALLICHEKSANQCYLAFFEALEQQKAAVASLVAYASDFAVSIGCSKLVIGLEGHVNYGLGLVNPSGIHEYQGYPSFGEAYNPDYYTAYFNEIPGLTPKRFVSYEDSALKVSQRVYQYMERLGHKRQAYGFEYADFSNKHFKETMKRYTDLNNDIFDGFQPYYYRDIIEDQELFHSMRPLLDPENLIIIKKNGEDIGFILWYFDYNELVKVGRKAGISTFLKYRLLNRIPDTIKIVEIGVKASERRSPAILFLFDEVTKVSMAKHPGLKRLISSWIDETNQPSVMVTQKFAKEPYREYVIYEKELLTD